MSVKAYITDPRTDSKASVTDDGDPPKYYSPALVTVQRPGQDGFADTPQFLVSRKGLFNNKVAQNIHIMCRRESGWGSTSVLNDVAQYLDTSQNLLNAFNTATTYYIRSSNAADVLVGPGTGAQKVRIVYLDISGNQQVIEVSLNGTTAVAISSGISHIQWMEVSQLGTSEVSAGNITISSVTGAPTVAQIVEYIAAGGNRSMSGRYKIPNGFTGYIHKWTTRNVSTKELDIRIRAKVFSDDNTLSTVFHFLDTAFLASNTSDTSDLDYVKLPSLCEVKVSAISAVATSGNRLDACFHILLVSNLEPVLFPR